MSIDIEPPNAITTSLQPPAFAEQEQRSRPAPGRVRMPVSAVCCSIVCRDNSPVQIERLLGDIRSAGGHVRIYLIDHSPVGTLAAIARAFDTDYVHLPRNRNDGAAHNFAIRCGLAQGCDYHMVLDAGIHFPHEMLPAMLVYMETRRNIGLLSPGIDDSKRRPRHPCKLRPTPLGLLMRLFRPTRVRPAARPGPSVSHGSGDGVIWEAPALASCFMLIRGSVLRSIGGFDERMFPSFGNADLARRIGSVSRTRYFPGAAIGCDRAQGNGPSLRNLIGHLGSAVRYFNKWGWFAEAERDCIDRDAIRRSPLD